MAATAATGFAVRSSISRARKPENGRAGTAAMAGLARRVPWNGPMAATAATAAVARTAAAAVMAEIADGSTWMRETAGLAATAATSISAWELRSTARRRWVHPAQAATVAT